MKNMNLAGNKGYRKYLKSAGKARFEVDYDKADEEARYDGKWVLRTSTKLSAKDTALKYEQLWMVEGIFLEANGAAISLPGLRREDVCLGHAWRAA